MSDLLTAATEARSHFEQAERPAAGGYYWRTKEGAPDWATDLVFDAHDGRLPNDTDYALVVYALDFLRDYQIDNDQGAEDAACEFEDQAVPVHTTERVAWLAESLHHVTLCDEAADDFGEKPEDVATSIGWGMMLQARRTYESVLRSLTNLLETCDA